MGTPTSLDRDFAASQPEPSDEYPNLLRWHRHIHSFSAAEQKDFPITNKTICSSREEPKEVEPLGVPEGAVVGDRVTVEGHDSGEPDEVLNPKKKVWEKLAVDLATDGASGLAQWQGNTLEIKGKGPVTVKTVKGAPIK